MRLNNIKLFNLTSFLGAALLASLALLICSDPMQATLLTFEITMISSTSIDFIVVLDTMGLIFILLVSAIATSVLIYSQDYMASDTNKNRLSGLLALFIISMFLLITTPNLITLLLGWDGLGVISFVLVLFYNNHSSAGAALITALTNRVGDILILFSMGLYLKVGHWDFYALENLSSDLLVFILMVAACTKSAQFPFSAWLPQAMAAPTPVSALVHSSTLVTAGVYLMIRLSGRFTPCYQWQAVIGLMATITSVMAGLCALIETDLKKIVALSTLSQLGTMVLAISLGLPLLAFFHLATHAVSKSLLFICVGSFISFNKGGQDTRNLKSQLWAGSPMSLVGAIIASSSLCGLPFISGFYSKDLILESLWQSPESSLTIVGAAVSTSLTSAYSIKLIKLTSEGNPTNESSPSRLKSKGETKFTKIPVMFLSSATLFSGYFLSKTWTLLYTPLLLSGPHKYLASLMLISGIVLAIAESQLMIGPVSDKLTHHFLHTMFFLEKTSSQGVMSKLKTPLYYTYKTLETGFIEKLSTSAIHSFLILIMSMNARLAKAPSLSYVAYSFFVLVVLTYSLKSSPLL